MKNELSELLETLGYEVYEQGSFTDSEEYPEHFFTIWNDGTEALNYYDNKEEWLYMVFHY